MTQKLELWLQEIRKKHGRTRIWKRVLSFLMAVTVFSTTYALILPAITMENTYCGMEEHTHSVEDGCYIEHKTLICTQEETAEETTEAGHVHTDACYEEQSVLTCTAEEAEGHTHGEECHDEEGALICTLEESEGHRHSEACYQTEKVLICGKEETAADADAHVHTDACYETTLELTCEKEVHQHVRMCYSNPDADVENEYTWGQSVAGVKLTGVWADDVLAIAASQLGYRESTENYTVEENGAVKGYSRYGAWYGMPYGDWCAMFVSFCLNYARIDRELMPIESGCASWVQKLSELRIYHPTGNADDRTVEGYVAPEEYMPEPGDVIFFDWDNDGAANHVGLVCELITNENGTAAQVKTIEGNQGDVVCYCVYELTDYAILGYGELPENPNPQNIEDENTEESDTEPETEKSDAEPETAENITLSVETENNVTITMTAPADAFDVSAEELSLRAVAIEDEAAKELLEQEAAANDGENVKRSTMLFDISVMHGDEFVQPKKPVQVSFSGIETPKDDAQVFHVDTDAEVVEKMTVEKNENGDITMEAPHFSIYGVTFTVDFHNGDIIFSIAGESEVLLSTVFEKLNIERSITDVVSVEFSNPELIAVEKDGDDWRLTSLQSFETEEDLTITFKDGEVYKIKVTDPPYVNGIPVLTPTDKVAVIDEAADTVSYYATLDAAMQYIGTGTASYTIVFTQDYTSTQTDWNAVASNGAQAQKITFTSTYNDGTSDVRSSLNMLGASIANHDLSTETEFKNIAFSHGNNNPRINARGHKLIMGEGITNSTGNTMYIFGGDYSGNVASADVTVLSGNYATIFAGCNFGFVSGKTSIIIGGSTTVTNVVASGGATPTPATAEINITIDGSYGAGVKNVVSSYRSISSFNGTVSAGAVLNTTIKNMKDIEVVNLYSFNSGSGKLTIDGDVQVQNSLSTNNNLTDVELLSDATLTVGSNSDESVAGSGSYSGYFYTGKDLILNSNSKLIFAGNNAEKTVMNNLTVQGAGAEIDIFKSGTKAYPLSIRGTGAYMGTDTLKLGIHKDPNTAGTIEGCLGDVLLSYNTASNAKVSDYIAGTGIDGVFKEDGNITADKFLDDPIDVGIGWMNIGVENPYHDISDPASAETCTIQYIGGSNKPYARDKNVASSYTLTGTNNDDYPNLLTEQAKVKVNRDITVELILDNVAMEGGETKAFEVSYANVTFTLKDGSRNIFKVLSYSQYTGIKPGMYDYARYGAAGVIGKNGMSGTLIMRCEHSDEPGHRCEDNGTCGFFEGDASLGNHAPGIGSYLRYAFYDTRNDTGFSNLYIKGGIYNIKASYHNAGIGTTCFLWQGNNYQLITLLNGLQQVYLYSPVGSPASKGEMCKNLNISKARVTVYGGLCAPGIGGGYGGMMDGLVISDGAYVYAEGGEHSPGIGSGSADANSHPQISDYAFHVKNIKVAGGDTVVEVVGGTGLQNAGVAGSVYMPGIGVGGSNQSPGYHAAGSFTNAYAEPDAGYSAIIKQGTTINPAQAVYIDGAPNSGQLDIKVDQPYTLIYFTKIDKTASVKPAGGTWQPDNTGSQAAPVAVKEGDQVRYKLNLSEIVNNNDAVSGDVSDFIPLGMTLVTDPSTYTPGMGHEEVGGRTKVYWNAQNFTNNNTQFYFTVTVDSLPGGVYERDYENTATLQYQNAANNQLLSIDSNPTFHHVEKEPGVDFTKVNEAGEPVSGAGFTIFECTNTAQGHVHTDGTCTWDANSPLKVEVVSGANGNVSFTGLARNKQYLMVETTTPAGMIVPSPQSYILIDLQADGTYTLTGLGSFAAQGMVSNGNTGYTIKNLTERVTLTVSKTVPNAPQGLTDLFEFTVDIVDGQTRFVPADGTYSVVDANGNTVQRTITKAQDGRLTVSLGNGEKLVVTNVTAGFTAEAREAEDNRYEASYIIDPDPNAQPPQTATALPANRTVTQVMDADHEIKVINEMSVTDLTVKKTVVGSAQGDTFSFSLTPKDAAVLNRIPDDTNNPARYTKANGAITFDLKNGEQVTIPGIPVGAELTLTETKHDGYTVSIYDITAGRTLLKDGDTAELTLDAAMKIEVMNNPGVELPHTGGIGTHIYTIGGLLMMFAAAVVSVFGKRRRERRYE